MKLNSLRVNLLFFMVVYILSIILFTFLSYRFFISDFINLEEKLNKNNISTFLKSLDKTLINLNNITKDYSVWDDTYKFIKDANSEYLYENFRDGSNTLEDLQIDALIFINLKNSVVFSTYNSLSHFENKKEFEKFIIKRFENNKKISTIFKYKKQAFYLVKHPIMKSDAKSDINGYLISIKFLNQENLFLEHNTLFNTIKINNNKIIKNNIIKTPLQELTDILISYEILSDKIINYIGIYDSNKKFLFTIQASNKDFIVSKGKSAITLFNIIGSFIFLLIFIVVYQNQKLIINQNRSLNRKIIKRTRQLNKAYKTLKTKNRALFKLANIDSLTNIKNRASFFSKSIYLLKESNKSYSKFAIIIIDIDHFKKINDMYSHAVGDKVLIKFAETVNAFITEEMVFGRIGGEEFCITIYDKDSDFVYEFAEQIRKKCSQTTIKVDDNSINFTISVGVAFKENSNQTIDGILHNADLLLYEAKKNGRNKVIRKTHI
ncbi:MAG: diguanylate cyclase [Halarcobacter sp.]